VRTKPGAKAIKDDDNARIGDWCGRNDWPQAR
jgi:hypothetical protein